MTGGTQSSLKGRVVPLPAGVYGVRVYPGPSLAKGGMWNQCDPHLTGVALVPSRGTMLDWLRQFLDDPSGGPRVSRHFLLVASLPCPPTAWFSPCLLRRERRRGGWHPRRSTSARWEGSDEVYYYKAGYLASEAQRQGTYCALEF